VLTPDARSSIRVSSSSSSIPAPPSTVSRDHSFFFHLFHFENLAEFNPKNKNKNKNKRAKLAEFTPEKLTTMCFQFNMLNIYHPHGCH
jgi:hypothetical protein